MGTEEHPADRSIVRSRILALTAALALSPAVLFAQAAPRSCAAADSVLGPITAAQRRAALSEHRWSAGEQFVRTGTRRLSESGLAIVALRPPGGVPDDATIQVEVNLPFEDAMRGVQAGDSLSIEIEGGERVPLGVPTPATIAGSRQPALLPLSALLPFGDLERLAKGATLTLRYGTRRIPFRAGDLASTNALYRVLACASGQP